MIRPYFDERMVNRQRLLWVVATRRQLERWEALVAKDVRLSFARRRGGLDNAEIWGAAVEHHFALIAARNVIRALDLDPVTSIPVDPTMRSEIIEGRDLHEHWDENMPVFNMTPRVAQPRFRSGIDFANRNPRVGPYDWLAWSNKTGAQLLPHVSAPQLHELLDAVQADVVGRDQELTGSIPLPAPSPWIRVNGVWWPHESVDGDT